MPKHSPMPFLESKTTLEIRAAELVAHLRDVPRMARLIGQRVRGLAVTRNEVRNWARRVLMESSALIRYARMAGIAVPELEHEYDIAFDWYQVLDG